MNRHTKRNHRRIAERQGWRRRAKKLGTIFFIDMHDGYHDVCTTMGEYRVLHGNKWTYEWHKAETCEQLAWNPLTRKMELI
jgi:hypothetical protein